MHCFSSPAGHAEPCFGFAGDAHAHSAGGDSGAAAGRALAGGAPALGVLPAEEEASLVLLPIHAATMTSTDGKDSAKLKSFSCGETCNFSKRQCQCMCSTCEQCAARL